MPLSTKEIEKKLEEISSLNDPFISKYKKDHRKSVQTLIQKWIRKYEREKQLIEEFNQMQKFEKQAKAAGFNVIAGIDEVGRGPLAGPVVAAAVVLDEYFFLPGLTDSKKLSWEKREEFYDFIMGNAKAVGIGVVTSEEIDQLNIYEATKKAMLEAITSLSIEPDYLLIDAMKLPINTKQSSIIKGDAKSISIAASSCIAKVTRDRMMKQYAEIYPEYGLEKHMGYGTKQHLEAIKSYGATPIHRMSFAPLKLS
ncbi:ribonuclease HII [Metabacillus arenae]|uniref:Ribonuclease HII n=1 Tax=Metabacillus arenae TaxID=2771434 RepID=A0A926RVS9_9BACI|nr:ribonuclease HII [Metabacillus arenae]MBD1380028.1 ribonuclease HII [Metabacillus arenae]